MFIKYLSVFKTNNILLYYANTLIAILYENSSLINNINRF